MALFASCRASSTLPSRFNRAALLLLYRIHFKTQFRLLSSSALARSNAFEYNASALLWSPLRNDSFASALVVSTVGGEEEEEEEAEDVSEEKEAMTKKLFAMRPSPLTDYFKPHVFHTLQSLIPL